MLIMSKCNIDLLINACQAAYHLDEKGFYPSVLPHTLKKTTPFVETIERQGYKQVMGAKPDSKKSKDKSLLAAICLVPSSPEEPIVIAFRGTKSNDDLISDLSIMTNGFAKMRQLDEAYQFYLKVRKNYPNSPIVISGHSLGGHIAQYVGLKAHENEQLPENGIAIRTFNTAPIASRLSKMFSNQSDITAKFINYRSSNDPVSTIPYYHYFGNTYSFQAKQSNIIDSHRLWGLSSSLPKNVKESSVSLTPKDLLIENIHGAMHAYEVYINSQLLTSFRQGRKNLTTFKNLGPKLIESLSSNDFDTVNELIRQSRSQISGKISTAKLEMIQNQILQYQSKLEHQTPLVTMLH